MRTITLSGREQRKAEILSRLTESRLDVKTAGDMLGVGERQAYRLQARYRREGLAALVHGNGWRKRGARPIHRS